MFSFPCVFRKAIPRMKGRTAPKRSTVGGEREHTSEVSLISSSLSLKYWYSAWMALWRKGGMEGKHSWIIANQDEP